MKSKIVLPYFTEEKYKSKKIKLLRFLYYLQKSDSSHLFLLQVTFENAANSSERFEFVESLFKYSTDFDFVKEIPVTKVFEETAKVFSEAEFSLLELPNDKTLISTTLNRAYSIDEDGNILEGSYTETLSSEFSNDEKERQQIASNNLFFKAKVIPNSKQYVTLIDAKTSSGVNERRKRGDFIVKSDELALDEKPKFNLIASLDKTPSTTTPADFPQISYNDDSTVKKDDYFPHNLVEQVKTLTGKSMYNPWVDNIYPLHDNLTLVPFFEQANRMSGKGCYYIFLLINDEGKVIKWLKDIDHKTHNPYKLEEFNFAVDFDKKLVFYKAQSTFFIHDFVGNCVDKIEFEGKLISLTNFRFISLINSKDLLFFNPKNYHFLIVNNFEPNKDNEEIFLEALTNFRKRPTTAIMQ